MSRKESVHVGALFLLEMYEGMRGKHVGRLKSHV